MRKRFLFCCGTSRSGTTAFGNLLGSHPKVVLGFERFKSLATKVRMGEFGPHLFEKSRFFDFQAEDTNAIPRNGRYEAYYQNAFQKFDSAEVVGDKIPSMLHYLEYLPPAFNDAIIFIILRDPRSVAHSWKSLGETRQQGYWAGKTVRHAISDWNRGLLATEKAIASSRPVYLFLNESVFSKKANLSALCGPLGLETSEEFAATFATLVRQSNRVQRKTRTLTEEEDKFIAENANIALYDRLRNKAVDL